jgi:hypothetical protein
MRPGGAARAFRPPRRDPLRTKKEGRVAAALRMWVVDDSLQDLAALSIEVTRMTFVLVSSLPVTFTS